MDHDQKLILAQQQAPVVAAKIVEMIADIERDFRLAEGAVSDKLMFDIEAIMREAAPEPWEIAKTESSILLRSPDWKPTKGLGNGDAWFEISEIVDDEGQDHTWVGAAVGVGPSKFGLELIFRPGLAPVADTVMGDKAQAERLQKIGLKRDAATERAFIPIAVNRILLAKGFADNDLGEALGPVRKAVEHIVKAKGDLDALLTLVRDRAKRR